MRRFDDGPAISWRELRLRLRDRVAGARRGYRGRRQRDVPGGKTWRANRDHRKKFRAMGPGEDARVGEVVWAKATGGSVGQTLPTGVEPTDFILGGCGSGRVVSGVVSGEVGRLTS